MKWLGGCSGELMRKFVIDRHAVFHGESVTPNCRVPVAVGTADARVQVVPLPEAMAMGVMPEVNTCWPMATVPSCVEFTVSVEPVALPVNTVEEAVISIL